MVPGTEQAHAILRQVNAEVQNYLGDQIGRPFDTQGYDAERDIFCKEMIARCDEAEKQAPSDRKILLQSLILKAQLYGNWQKMQGSRGTQKSAIECYERAIPLVTSPQMEADVRYRYGVMCRVSIAGTGGGKEKAIENFKRVIQLVGPESELGIECARIIQEEQSTKSGMCFVATAAYGSVIAPEVVVLSRFRDEVLLRTSIGSVLVKFYYKVSPYFATAISRSDFFCAVVRVVLLRPAVKMVTKQLKSK
jgi:hypothetical protein